MLLRSWPVRFLITRAARAYGFLDPVAFVAKLRGFAQPSEVAEPVELLRAGMIFHARGLLNTKAIQNNLDWVWPFWVVRQFNPADESFIPRAFSFSHINLTHRNWTAVGVPDVPYYPLVDPRGLVTPQFDGWSIDFWLLRPDGKTLFPAELPEFEQTLLMADTLKVRSVVRDGALLAYSTEVSLILQGSEPHCCIRVEPGPQAAGTLVVALRPYNPEGISLLEKIEVLSDQCGWHVNGRNFVSFDRRPSHHLLSVYKDGDVSHRLTETASPTSVSDTVGMATAAAFFPLQGAGTPLEVRIPIYNELEPRKRPRFSGTESWKEGLAPMARLVVADSRVQNLYDLAVANLVLHCPGEVYPGPFTYKRFWFRDAAFVLNALLTLGAVKRTRRALEEFHPRQRHDGYFLSQEGEWDANGEAIWTYHRFKALSGEALPPEWLKAVEKGARWITRKRLPKGTGKPEAGLLPAGFSAEHLGPNDFYYWDDFWAISGLRCAADLLESSNGEFARALRAEADEFLQTVQASFPQGPQRRFPLAVPASPKRRMDSGAVGNLVADYPLQLFPPGDQHILKTADYLTEHSMHAGGFFQNMIHSGINAYLTLHLAQVRLRAGDVRAAWTLMERVADFASPTGQWPEAIHPRTLGGCMGDGQHIWAAGEWALMVRNCFVREEQDGLVIASGVPTTWIPPDHPAVFGPTLTPWGPVDVALARAAGGVSLSLRAAWRARPPRIRITLPGHAPQLLENAGSVNDLHLIPTP